ncbi:MAG: DUF362 domain-containing protein [Oscillospiraceae bacterium]|nr:DUF362 domain-containing protein [Oscillospiraceae bacterium]
MENRVYIAKCEDYEQERVSEAVERVLDEFGGAAAILGDGKKVVVKPNLIMPRKPEDAATTHPTVVEAVCAAFVKAGAEVSIIDSTGGPHTKLVLRMLYGKTGMKTAAAESGANISFNTKSKTVKYPEARIMQKFSLLSPVLDADLVISVAKMKTHVFQSMTGCVKNLFGCIPGMGKPLLHRKYSKKEDFAGMLVDICEYIKPGFNIIDGVYGMEGAGPTGGTPKHTGAIIGGLSPYTVDLAQCSLMGLRPDTVNTLHEAASRNLAPETAEQLTWLGENPQDYKKSYKPAIEHKTDAPPKILETCIGCGDCARICPMKCIEMQKATSNASQAKQNKIAVIDQKTCIRCYCCHEFCPAKAILV